MNQRFGVDGQQILSLIQGMILIKINNSNKRNKSDSLIAKKDAEPNLGQMDYDYSKIL